MTIEPVENTDLPARPPHPGGSAAGDLRDWLEDHGLLRLVKFGLVGMSGMVVNLTVFNVSYHFALAMVAGQPRFVVSTALGIIVSIFNNFMWNDRWTWGDREKGGRREWFKRLGKYYTTASVAGGVQLVVAWTALHFVWSHLPVHVLGRNLSPSFAVLTGIVCGMALNFVASHLWAFRDAESS